MDPPLGKPELAAQALAHISLGSPDAQATIAEEGAIPSLVAMLAPTVCALRARPEPFILLRALGGGGSGAAEERAAEAWARACCTFTYDACM